MKKPITTEEYFNLICGILREKGLIPGDILDYSLATHDPVPMRTYEFDVRNHLNYGASEGIYLDLAIEYFEDGKRQMKELGTFKTLQTDRKAMRTMAKLLADFLVEERDYVNLHLDDFTWTDADVYVVNADGSKAGWTYTCHNMTAALLRKDELLKRHKRVVIRDNATRKEREYKSSKSDIG